MGLFDKYPNCEVDYSEKSGDKDISGIDIYLEPVKLKAEKVGDSHKFVIKDNTTITITYDEYHMWDKVNQGDKIDGRIITEVLESRGIFGDIEFYIVRVEKA